MKNDQIREALVRLREKAGLSQAQLADRVKFTPSRVSRLESGDTDLSTEDADLMADAIGSEDAKTFATYLKSDWRILERPGFNHVNLAALWKAERVLQRIAEMQKDPKNAFVQQIQSCRHALESAAHALRSTEHPIVLMGAPGVGKTTVICTLAQLRRAEADPDLDKQMALQTGGGRQTLCEVHVRNGSEFNLSVEACTPEELQQYVSEFCDDMLAELHPDPSTSREGPSLSAEAKRALRNMTGLTVKRSKDADGHTVHEDLAVELARQFPRKDDLMVQVLLRLDPPRRNRTSVSFPRESTLTGLEWISKTFAEINYGRHPEFSLPRRIEISVPRRVLNAEEFDLRLIDTRGVDEPSAPRRDLQAYLDDPRAVVVLCSDFNDAPEATVQSILQRAVEGGRQQDLINRGLLLVLPDGDDDCTVRDPVTGEFVANAADGREIRREQMGPTLHQFGLRSLCIHFADVRSPDDCERLRTELLRKVEGIRQRRVEEIESLASTIDRLMENRKGAEPRAVFDAATKALRNWLKGAAGLPQADMEVQSALLEDIERVRWASSLRASVNRRGNWHNFDYWHGLGFGTRREVVARAAKRVGELKVLIEAVLRDPELTEAHGFMRHFANQLEKEASDFYQASQTLGEGAFQGQLGEDFAYWRRCQERWGGGPGYKMDIQQWTTSWFEAESSQQRREYIEEELQRQWRQLLERLDAQLASAEPTSVEPNVEPILFR